MFLADFLIVLMLALLFTAVFAFSGIRSAPWPSMVWLFMILLFATWALAVRFRPIGPPVRGVYWATFVVAIFLVSLLLAAAHSIPRSPREKTRDELRGVEIRPLTPIEEEIEEERAEEAVKASFGFLFWILVIVAIATLIAHYRFPHLF